MKPMLCKITLSFILFVFFGCTPKGTEVNIVEKNPLNTEVIENKRKPQAYFINEKVAGKIYNFSSAVFLNDNYPSSRLDNCILELKLTKHYNDNGYAFYDFYYFTYPKNSDKPNCKNTIGITLFGLYEKYTNEQLDKLLNKKIYVYAPNIRYNPVDNDDLVDYECGTYSSIDVFDGWKIIENLDFYDLLPPTIVNK